MGDEKAIVPVASFSLSAGITALFVAVITIAGELNPSLEDSLKATFGHHWIGKSVIATGIFIVLSGILWQAFKGRRLATIRTWVYASILLAVIAVSVIFGFFAYEFIL